MASIVVVSGASRGNYLSLEPRVMTIGRDDRCDMQVLDESVSRRHLEVGPGSLDGEFVLTDVSAHGVRVNGRRVREQARLHESDLILIGGSELVFTRKAFHDKQGALSFAAHGQRNRPTLEPGR